GGALGHPPQLADEPGELLRVLRQPLVAEDDGGNDEQHDELAAVDAEHSPTLTRGSAAAYGSCRRPPRSRTSTRERGSTAQEEPGLVGPLVGRLVGRDKV